MAQSVALAVHTAYILFGLMAEMAHLPAPWVATLSAPGPALVGAALPLAPAPAPTATSLRMVRWREIPL